jgi:4-aminobutyrate aminotransferase-like enzyme
MFAMPNAIQFPNETRSNAARQVVADREALALRTFTPSQAVLAKSAGVFHWTPENRRLYDYSSGVLVANLGHNPKRWLGRLAGYMGWSAEMLQPASGFDDYYTAAPLTAYNAVTEIETRATERLVQSLQASAGGARLQTVMWAASGSEAVQKALWACLHRDESRDIILATRYGFHGKKGLAGAVTGCETDRDRDPRVKFISFPMAEYDDASKSADKFDPAPYVHELERLWAEYGQRINCLITEPYLGGGGSFHPPAEYLQLLQRFCRAHDIAFILDEVQANFGRCGRMYAFESYGLEPDFVTLGKGLGNGVPVSAAVGRADIIASLKYGEASDTWSANTLGCAAVLATLDEFESTPILEHTRGLTPIFFDGLNRLKETGLIAKVRGEREGLVYGIECAPRGALSGNEVAVRIVEAAYLGLGNDGIHLLGPLAGKVIRVSPPLTISRAEARASLDLFHAICQNLAERLSA